MFDSWAVFWHLASSIGGAALTGLILIWKIGRIFGGHEAEHRAMWEWYKRTHNGSAEKHHERP